MRRRSRKRSSRKRSRRRYRSSNEITCTDFQCDPQGRGKYDCKIKNNPTDNSKRFSVSVANAEGKQLENIESLIIEAFEQLTNIARSPAVKAAIKSPNAKAAMASPAVKEAIKSPNAKAAMESPVVQEAIKSPNEKAPSTSSGYTTPGKNNVDETLDLLHMLSQLADRGTDEQVRAIAAMVGGYSTGTIETNSSEEDITALILQGIEHSGSPI